MTPDGIVEVSPWLSLLAKLGLLIGACFVAYLVVKIVVGLLASVIAWSSPEAREKGDQATDADERIGESIERVPGLHVLSDYGAEHRLVDRNPSERTIRTTIRSLDWHGGFHQVLLVTYSGDCFEVGGSLDPDDGLSSSYGQSKKGILKVISEAPTTVGQMEDLMVSFYRGDGVWERLNVYE